MTMLTCVCPLPTSACSLEAAIQAVLQADAAFVGIPIYTGGRVSLADTGNEGPVMPYGVLADLGANNSQRLGENLTKHEIQIRLRIWTTTDQQGLSLAKSAREACFAAGQMETIEGYARVSQVLGRATPTKVDSGRWMIQWNQTFDLIEPRE